MDSERAAEELKVLRTLMERPVRFTTQSGLAGLVAGAAAITGCLADYRISLQAPPVYAFWANLCVWAGVFLVAFVGVVTLTRLRERRQGMPFWSSAKRRILMTILPPFVAGVGLTVVIVSRWYYGAGPNEWGLIPAIWMTFYGLACWGVGEFSIVEVRVMGAAFILAGIASAVYQFTIPGLPPGTAPYWALGATFGGFHLIYGLVVLVRHGG